MPRKPKRYVKGRRAFVGASEVAALFGLHPHKTTWQLYMEKTGQLPEPELDDNERVIAGLGLEHGIARMAAKKWGWTVRKAKHAKHPEIKGMAATPDYIGTGEGGEYDRFLIQIKNVDGLIYQREWVDDQVPMHFQLQVQHEMACAAYLRSKLVVLVGGNDLRCFDFQAHVGVITKLQEAVKEFWSWVHNGTPPSPNYNADSAAISRLYRNVRQGKVIDLSQDNRARALCDFYEAAGAEHKAAKSRQEAARAELLEKLGDAETAICGPYTVKTTYVPGRHVAFDKPGYRMMRVARKDADG